MFSLAIVISKVALLIADFGIPQSLARFLAENRADRDAVTDWLADALKLKLLTAALSAGTLFASAPLLADAFSSRELTWPLRWVAVALFAESVMALYVSAFIALGKFGLNLGLIFLSSPWRPLRPSYLSPSAQVQRGRRSAAPSAIPSGSQSRSA